MYFLISLFIVSFNYTATLLHLIVRRATLHKHVQEKFFFSTKNCKTRSYKQLFFFSLEQHFTNKKA